MQVRSGGVAAVADGGDLIAGEHPLADLDLPGVDVAVAGHRAVPVLQQHPGAVAGVGGTRLLDHAVGGREHRRADRSGQVDPVVQGTPAVAEARGEQGLRRQGEQRTLQPRFARGALGGVGHPAGQFLGADRRVGGGLDRDQLHAARRGRRGQRHLVCGEHRAGHDRLVGGDHGVGGGRGSTDGHRRDQRAALGRARRVPAMLRRAGQHVGVLGAAEERALPNRERRDVGVLRLVNLVSRLDRVGNRR